MANLLTQKQWIEKAKEVHGDKYDYSKSFYKNARTKIKVICKKHGEFLITSALFLQGTGCRYCWKEGLLLTQEQFIEKANKVHDGKYDYSLVEYKNSRSKVKIICKNCNNTFDQLANNHLRGNNCPFCFQRYSQKEFIEKAKQVHGDKYDYSKSIYIDSQSKIEIICKIHGVFWQQANSHLQNQGCPICKESKGEKSIRQFLKDNNIRYLSQYKFDDCKNIRKLPFDFYLPDLNICIEFDGKQHFSIHSWSTNKSEEIMKENLEKIQKKDQIKTKYCKDNNIKLIRIPYFKQKNIEKILKEEINENYKSL